MPLSDLRTLRARLVAETTAEVVLAAARASKGRGTLGQAPAQAGRRIRLSATRPHRAGPLPPDMPSYYCAFFDHRAYQPPIRGQDCRPLRGGEVDHP